MKLEKVVNSGIPVLCGALLLIMIALTFLQIVLRQFFNFTFSWSDEVSQFCMMWMVLLGSIWVTKNNCHLNTGIKLHQRLKGWQIRLIDRVSTLAIAVSTAVVAYQSAIFSFQEMNMASITVFWLKLGYVFVMLPLAMAGICYYYIKKLLQKD
jgi:TRAP-type C4-dicarboxylate transport system permease small subunit